MLLLAAALRLWELERLPGGLHFDLAANLFDAVEVGEGARPVYFPRNNGREPLVIYMQALAGMLLGVTAFSARLVTVGLGVASVAAVGFAARQVVLLAGWERRRAEVAALVAGGVLAGMYWSVHFSRFGLRTAAVPLLLALAFGLVARGLRGRSWVEQLAAGLCLGLALDSYTGARLAPMAMALPFLVGLAWEKRLRWLAWLALLALGAAAAFAPLGLHYIRQPADFAQHSYDTSVLSAGSPGWAAVRGVATTAAAFVVRGSPGAAENLPGRPLLDPLGAMLLLAGLVVAVSWLRGPLGARLAAVLLLGWLAVMSLPSALAVPSPGYVRLSGAVPAAALMAALGGVALAEWTSRRLGAWFIRARAGRSAVWRLAARWGRLTRAERGDGADLEQVAVLVATIVAISAAWTAVDYFGTWATREAYRAAMQDKADAAAWLLARPPGERVFLAPLWATDFGVQFLTRARPPQSFTAGLIIPTDGAAATYAYPAEDVGGPEELRAQLHGQPAVELVRDPTGRHELLRVVRLPAGAEPRPAGVQRLEDGLGVASVHARRQGERIVITIRWFVETTPTRDYTAFVQVREDGVTRVQQDRPPLDGTIPTGRWRPGDLVVDRRELPRPADLGTAARVHAGLYDASGRRPRLIDGQGRVASVDELVVSVE